VQVSRTVRGPHANFSPVHLYCRRCLCRTVLQRRGVTECGTPPSKSFRLTISGTLSRPEEQSVLYFAPITTSRRAEHSGKSTDQILGRKRTAPRNDSEMPMECKEKGNVVGWPGGLAVPSLRRLGEAPVSLRCGPGSVSRQFMWGFKVDTTPRGWRGGDRSFQNIYILQSHF
jgi:hypothetical protein